MARLDSLLDRYQRLVFFDTETTGLQYHRDQIIEFAAVVVTGQQQEEYDQLVALAPGSFVPPEIQKLTGISTQDLQQRGLPKTRVCRDIGEMLQGNSLLVAYNAHFDLSFLYYLLREYGDPTILKGRDKLDLLTVYRDRREYPHRLSNAIQAYGLEAVNSHRAVDDVLAAVEVAKAMAAERDDLTRYINLFGYNPKYGVEGKPIGSVVYKPQPYGQPQPLYETGKESPNAP